MKKPILLLSLLISTCLLLTGCGPTKITSNPQFAPPTVLTQSPSEILLSGTKGGEAGQSSSLLPTEPSSTAGKAEVPLPTGEDIVRLFFRLINEKRVPEAVAMLSQETAPDEITKQTWELNFKSLRSITIKSIEEWRKNDWNEKQMTFKVILRAEVRPESSFYAWDNGENTRWIKLKKEANLWKVFQIATGP
jgi:hypothetical protein